jgi:hypothetical protein
MMYELRQIIYIFQNSLHNRKIKFDREILIMFYISMAYAFKK